MIRIILFLLLVPALAFAPMTPPPVAAKAWLLLDVGSGQLLTAVSLIEVKGRRIGSATVTVTKNEILTALNRPEGFILAVVEVDGERTRTTYLRRPFTQAPDFGATSVNYDIQDLLKQAEILLTK